MISACRDCLKPLVFNGKGPIFTTFYAKGLQALKVWAKIEKKGKRILQDSNPRRHRYHEDLTALPVELSWKIHNYHHYFSY